MTKAQWTSAFIFPKNNTKSVVDSLLKGAASFDLIWNNITFYWTRFWLMSALETGSGPIKSITFIHLYHDVLNANQSRIWPNLHWWFALMIYRDDLQVGFRQYVTFGTRVIFQLWLSVSSRMHPFFSCAPIIRRIDITL